MKNILKKSILALGLTTTYISGAYAGFLGVIWQGGVDLWRDTSGVGIILNAVASVI